MKDADDIKRKVRAPKRAAQAHDWSKGLSTGSTLVNLACSGRAEVGLLPGHVYLFVGDSQAGKTWLLLQTFAEAARSPAYAAHRLVYDQPERGALMDYRDYFGERMERRVRGPAKGNSATQDAFLTNVKAAVAKGPCVYGLDSEDALAPDTEANGYSLDKAKKNASLLREVNSLIEESNSIVIAVKQSRQSIGFGSQFNPKVYSGGTALKFYNSLELWFSVRGDIKRTVRGKPVSVGSYLQIQTKKNRESGRRRTVTVPFRPEAGMDETESMVDYLVEWKHWKGGGAKDEADKAAKTVTAPEFDFSGPKEDLIRIIEGGSHEDELRLIVADVWQDVERLASVERKKRYD